MAYYDEFQTISNFIMFAEGLSRFAESVLDLPVGDDILTSHIWSLPNDLICKSTYSVLLKNVLDFILLQSNANSVLSEELWKK